MNLTELRENLNKIITSKDESNAAWQLIEDVVTREVNAALAAVKVESDAALATATADKQAAEAARDAEKAKADTAKAERKALVDALKDNDAASQAASLAALKSAVNEAKLDAKAKLIAERQKALEAAQAALVEAQK